MGILKKLINLLKLKRKKTPLTSEQLRELDEWVVISNQTIFKK